MPPAEKPIPHHWIGKLLRTLIAVLALGGMSVLLWRDRDAMGVLRSVSGGMCVLIVAIMSMNTVVFGMRVRLTLERVGGVILDGLWWQRVFINSFAMNLSVPQSGAVYRAVELRQRYGVSLPDYLRSYYVVVWLAYVLILLCASIAMTFTLSVPIVAGWDLRLVSYASVTALAFGPVLAHRVAPSLMGSEGWGRRIVGILDNTVGTALDCMNERRFAALFLEMSALTIATDVAIVWLTIRGLGVDISLAWSITFYLVIQLFNVVHITPGNIGVQELTFGVIGSHAGLNAGQGVVISLFMRVLRTLSLAVLFVGVNAVATIGRRRERTESQ
jgi:uncharacterized membrane protein YbhN (UPF0104 family)